MRLPCPPLIPANAQAHDNQAAKGNKTNQMKTAFHGFLQQRTCQSYTGFALRQSIPSRLTPV